MKKILSVLTMFVIFGSTVPAFANGFDNAGMHRNNIMPVQQRMQPKPEPNHKFEKSHHNNGKEVSRIIKGAAIGALIASIFD